MKKMEEEMTSVEERYKEVERECRRLERKEKESALRA
jgi:hypothetical protein